jgi:hypothetical protein
MPYLQDVIHKLEVGTGFRLVRHVMAGLVVLLLVLGYNWRAYKNLATQEAMDSCQVARNLAEGRGYTTFFVRPLSVSLLERHRQATTNGALAAASKSQADDTTKPKYHPDLSNPPAYPALLAGLMKVLPFNFEVTTTKPFWSSGGRFIRHQPDMLIALFNQLLFIVTVFLVFKLAQRLFDNEVAWITAAIFIGTELMWRFTVSGLSTIWLMLLFVGLNWCVVLIEQELREPKRGEKGVLSLALAAGALAGLGMLTRYSFGTVILPLVGFLLALGGTRRVRLALVAVLAFGVLVAPWIVRNFILSGTPFGTAGYVPLADTFMFSENRLERSLHPDLQSGVMLTAMGNKFLVNLSKILQNDLPKLSGTWVSAFFLVGLMVLFRNPATARARYFLLGCLAAFLVTQPLLQTHASEASPELNHANLLVLLSPFVIMYGVALFLMLLEQLPLPGQRYRWIPLSVFPVIACLPMFFVYLPPGRNPQAFPPYHPPLIQFISGWMKPHEVVMSDIPWAVAWYGQRQSAWLTLRALPEQNETVHEDMIALHKLHGPIRALYLSYETLDQRFISGMQGSDVSWGNLVLQIIETRAVPPDFPLSRSPAPTGDDLERGILSGRLILTDWERWRATN